MRHSSCRMPAVAEPAGATHPPTHLPSMSSSVTSDRLSTFAVSAVARAWMVPLGRKGSRPEVSITLNLQRGRGRGRWAGRHANAVRPGGLAARL